MTHLSELFLKANLYNKSSNKTLLLKNRSWLLMSNTSQIEKLIFRQDDKLVLIKDGSVMKGKWEYISQDDSLLIEYDDIIQLHYCLFLQSDLVCLLNQTNQSILFIVGAKHIVKNDLEFFKDLLYKKLNIRTATLDSGKKLEILDVSDIKKHQLIGKEVLMNFERVEDGIYYRNNGKVEFHIKGNKLIEIKKK